jgi:hypothetical protein
VVSRPEAIIQIHVSSEDGHTTNVFSYLPNTEQPDENVVGETAEEHLREDEDVGGQGGLQHDRHVGGIEELDGVGSALSTELVGLDRDLDTEALEVDDGGEDDGGGDEVHDVGEATTPESLTKSATFVVPGEEEVEEGNESTLKFWSTPGIDGGWRERFPDDRLADVSSDEERDTRTETVTLLEKFIEENDDKSGDDELDDQQKADTSAEVTWLAIKAGKDVDGGLTKRDNQRED